MAIGKTTRFSIRFRECDEKLLEFAKLQSNFTDSIRYLIEKELHENGQRNLQMVIPINRGAGYFQQQSKGGSEDE